MLFVLTGGIQTGKTHWLGRLVEALGAEGVRCAGVMAPGVWRKRRCGTALSAGELAVGSRAESEYEKLGIDNVLLPGGERVPFARRVDLACQAGAYDSQSQSARAGLGWAIDDAAIARVNAHFRALAAEAGPEIEAAESVGSSVSGVGSADPSLADARQHVASLLIVDELGRLELMRGEGLVEAMALLDRGPTRAFPHALVVVREDLLPLAHKRLAPAWGAPEPIRPDDAGVDRVHTALGMGGVARSWGSAFRRSADRFLCEKKVAIGAFHPGSGKPG